MNSYYIELVKLRELGVYIVLRSEIAGLNIEGETFQEAGELCHKFLPTLAEFAEVIDVHFSLNVNPYELIMEGGGEAIPANFDDDIAETLQAAECECVEYSEVCHSVWETPRERKPFLVPQIIKSRHIANAVMTDAGLPRKF